MIERLELTQSNAQQNIEQLQNPTMGVTINNEPTSEFKLNLIRPLLVLLWHVMQLKRNEKYKISCFVFVVVDDLITQQKIQIFRTSVNNFKFHHRTKFRNAPEKSLTTV